MPRSVMIVIVLALVGIPMYYFAHSYADAAKLYEGDVLEERDCRQCNGTGEDTMLDMPSANGKCLFCRGTGRVEVIIPGPNRPTRFYGSVVDADAVDELLHFDHPAFSPGWVFLDLPGGVAGATVRFTPRDGSEPKEVQSNGKGRFLIDLRPGAYDVSATAAGFQSDEGEVEVDVLSGPIWLEKANIIENPDDFAFSDERPAQQSREIKFFLVR